VFRDHVSESLSNRECYLLGDFDEVKVKNHLLYFCNYLWWHTGSNLLNQVKYILFIHDIFNVVFVIYNIIAIFDFNSFILFDKLILRIILN